MTALTVIALIVIFIAADWAVLRRRRRTKPEQAPALPIPAPQPPADRFMEQGHSWARLTTRGIQIGISDLLTAALGQVERIQALPPGKRVERGDPLLRLRSGGRWLELPSPLTGEVLWHNEPTLTAPQTISEDPYGAGWILTLEVRDQKAAIAPLQLGQRAVTLLRQEQARLEAFLSEEEQAPNVGVLQRLDAAAWERFQAQFLAPAEAPR